MSTIHPLRHSFLGGYFHWSWAHCKFRIDMFMQSVRMFVDALDIQVDQLKALVRLIQNSKCEAISNKHLYSES